MHLAELAGARARCNIAADIISRCKCALISLLRVCFCVCVLDQNAGTCTSNLRADAARHQRRRNKLALLHNFCFRFGGARNDSAPAKLQLLFIQCIKVNK
jgi:hypothetical protein